MVAWTSREQVGTEKSVGLWIFLEAESTGFADGLNVNVREK